MRPRRRPERPLPGGMGRMGVRIFGAGISAVLLFLCIAIVLMALGVVRLS